MKVFLAKTTYYEHGRRGSKWFGGAPKFCPKIDLKVAWQINRFFCPKKGDLKKKKGPHSCCDGFSVQRSEYFSGQTCPNDINLPKILTQNRPKYMKLPKISTPYTNRGGPVPPGPPTSYAYDYEENLKLIVKVYYNSNITQRTSWIVHWDVPSLKKLLKRKKQSLL